MLRIMLATSGSYYVQEKKCYGEWKMVGKFHTTRRDAREFAKDWNKCYGRDVPLDGKLVCYC